ncbi:MAG: hypothetical protein A2X34_06720 [Elusimicrobia bacterium GWC2_51_8]|nr:MAG: hypothetical protein A2X33_10645 [Elusimicrobia bacterium GWA2_51_34]OGR61362.1 MAG: hypothetical protein A2X34_06720 [Elusimicrobia bacterium GWC2_51_8]OGR86305.1 MAG: hypothetical protein A2021_06695 [Elusimicrobia bacterium GWF2_52_66]HAF95166.1 hypothetical protein [Elusimicrobiota bacterium]HCE98404.1 hypothetical protein [Elusimicrobiota bacterium]
MKLLNIFFLAFLISARTAGAQTVSFKITPPSKKPKLAEPFKLRLEASYAGNYAVKIDTASIDNKFFEILKIKQLSSKESGGASAAEFEFEAEAFSIGVSTFPEITFQFSGNGVALEAKSPSFQLEIEPLFEKAKTGEPADIRDIHPPLKFTPWLWLIAAFLALCALGYFLYARRKKPAAASIAGTQKDARTPYRRAMDNLEALALSDLWAEGKIKDFYIGFSGIFRLYLKEQFALDALLMTTAGLSKELKKTGAAVQTLIKSRELLERSDLVKFAKFRPQQKDSDLAALREILGELTPPSGRTPATPDSSASGDGTIEQTKNGTKTDKVEKARP